MKDARILDNLDDIKYKVHETRKIISRLVQARATISLGLACTYSEPEKIFYSKCYDIIHNAMLDIIYLDKETKQ